MIETLGVFLTNFGRWFYKTFDFSDFVGLGGLGMIFFGLYQWMPHMAYVVVGGIVFVLAVLDSMRR